MSPLPSFADSFPEFVRTPVKTEGHKRVGSKDVSLDAPSLQSSLRTYSASAHTKSVAPAPPLPPSRLASSGSFTSNMTHSGATITQRRSQARFPAPPPLGIPSQAYIILRPERTTGVLEVVGSSNDSLKGALQDLRKSAHEATSHPRALSETYSTHGSKPFRKTSRTAASDKYYARA
ncbi:hypothetical protein EXIGLDRAFT_776877 [Exidia glandulosa HHB12029]|uniref:Uncharacterized protein n=1 Tax=Exidia glandulosa HHB12029 TaxID=1314781 RepID=A0A165DAJ2_EXIGL|nr:hypothetical protein EXIGLDRAFT_776877 [Exidia glandulosa HHB12029]